MPTSLGWPLIVGFGAALLLAACAQGGPTVTPTPPVTAIAAPAPSPTPMPAPTPTEALPLAPTLTPTPLSTCRFDQSEIYVMNADGTHLTRLTYSPANDSRPAWSPDGSKIASHSDRDGKPEIYVMNADGTDQSRLTDNSAIDSYPFIPSVPAWSPDGTKIAFQSYRDGKPEIYVMDADGSNQTRLTTGNNVFAGIPAGVPPPSGGWDPSTTFVSYRYTKRSEIVPPAWSPDSSKIVFVSTRDRNYEIYVMDADGSNRTRLSKVYSSVNPTWSPDGSRIAFLTYNECDIRDERRWLQPSPPHHWGQPCLVPRR